MAWICDPMHGKYVLRLVTQVLTDFSHHSTQTSSSGLKTRDFNNIVSELTSSLRIHNECNSRLGGVSLEFTGELSEDGFSVTECVGGSMGLSEEDLVLRYQVRKYSPTSKRCSCCFQSFCDPRLNFEQSLGA